MKLAVIGSRSIRDENLVFEILDQYKYAVNCVISGGAHGVDLIVEKWANQNNIPLKVYLPDWQKYGKGAGIKRNWLIVQECTKCVAIWDGFSNGTKSTIMICKKLNKPCDVYQLS